MPRSRLLPLAVPLGLALAACSSGAGTPAPPTPLLVTAGTHVIEPSREAPPAIDLGQLGAAGIAASYRLTTPADTPFQFELVSWQANAQGAAMIDVNHVRAGDTEVVDDPLSFARAGMIVLAPTIRSTGGWTTAAGDGFVRLTLQGRIAADQVLAVHAGTSEVVAIEIAIGPASAINRPPASEPEVSGIVSRDTVYSSDAWQFGFPTVAVSGDRTSIVCYEGDRADPNRLARYEQRLQFDAATHAVTGGAVSLGETVGMSRDHEIVALYNVLGVVRSDAAGVQVRLSFDRGATFAQAVQVLAGETQSRLVQAAIAADYSLAIGAWRATSTGLEFVLVEGRAVAFDPFGSPTWYQFEPEQVLYAAPATSSPLTTGIAWSTGGDLVVGYAYNSFAPGPGAGWTSTTEFRCATRRYGQPIVDTLVDREQMYGMDPTVAVLGEGSALRIFYAYEVRAGIRLATSDDLGLSFVRTPAFGRGGDHLPTVLARDLGGATRVDVLYLANREAGVELHRTYWADWPGGAPVEEALTRASVQQVPYSMPTNGLPPPFPYGLRVRQVNFLGYDAVRDGSQLVIAYDEVEFDNVYVCLQMFQPMNLPTTAGYIPPSPFVIPPSPPPLAPGLTEPMPAPDAAHAHQLKLLRLE